MFGDQQTADQPQNLDSNVTQTAGTAVPSLGGPVDTAEPVAVDTPAPDPIADLPAAPLPEDGDTSETPLPTGEDLEDIKKHALDDLSPLVNQLDQPPEERYKTLMMMIQASDNQELVKDAYAAAQQIEDEKARAEALLTIINEINYLTQAKS